jgi:oxygen-dependent protoporphyrinogen oxidase
VIVGGGISGLVAGYRLVGAGLRVTVLEAAERVGGKLRTFDLAGGPAEAGAEAFLARDPRSGGPSAVSALVEEVGLGSAVTAPRTGAAAIALDGSLRPMPAGTLLGIPGDLAALRGVARPDAAADTDTGRPLLAPGEDTGVGALVRRRLGDEVADRLVDPLLGGVYAGRVDAISLRAAVPALATAAETERTLVTAVRAALTGRPPGAGPALVTLRGGVGGLVDALAGRLGDRVRTGVTVRELSRTATGWRLVAGSARAPEVVEADAVVLAVPARPAARLLSQVDGGVSRQVGALDYASVALVSLVLPEVALPDLAGVLVPATQGYALKAVTFVDRKWAHAARPGLTLVRASFGRYGEERVLQREDPELVALAGRELGALLGTDLPAPVEAVVHRWGGALPQYAPGHVERVSSARAALPPTLALAGAAVDGVGIAACVSSATGAARSVVDSLRALQGLGT